MEPEREEREEVERPEILIGVSGDGRVVIDMMSETGGSLLMHAIDALRLAHSISDVAIRTLDGEFRKGEPDGREH